LESTGNTILVSAACAWELAIKVNLGKLDALPLVMKLPHHMEMEEEEFSELPIGLDHAVWAGLLPLHHGDPFDRLLVAQAQALNVPILSADAVLDRYGVNRIW
jgi:PIN domain nuclease of toxin-antitoxin system